MQREFQPTVYLLANRRNGAIYTGVTSDLIRRIQEHREGLIPGFTKQHGIKMLVWFEQHSTMEHAIIREKRIKKWLRVWKIELIERDNLGWTGPKTSGFCHWSRLGPRFRGDDGRSGIRPNGSRLRRRLVRRHRQQQPEQRQHEHRTARGE